jgi:uncharacterized membrane protein
LSFAVRILTGSLAGATVGAAGGKIVLGIVCGAVGALVGTLGGAAARARLASLFGRDYRAAILEDVVAIGIALFAILKVA